MLRSHHDRIWSSEKRFCDPRPHKATARRSMTGRFAMIISIFTVLAVIPLQATYADQAQIKFSDPDFQPVWTPPLGAAPEGAMGETEGARITLSSA